MKTLVTPLKNSQGFALITAIMMLFAATVMGIMVTNSSHMEILLSGAQQRYEQSFAIAEGASNTEAIILSKDQTVNDRRYVVEDPNMRGRIVSPMVYSDDNFDPQSTINEDPGLPTGTIDTEAREDLQQDPKKWPSNSLIAGENSLAYRYFAVYNNWDTVRKGYDSSNQGEMAEFSFQMDVANWNTTTQSFNAHITTGNSRIGPRPSYEL
jgi:hypothetical protein